jgi:AraC family transcriptional regulator
MPHIAHKHPNARVMASSAERDWPGLLAELLEHPAGRIRPFESIVTESDRIRCVETAMPDPDRIRAVETAVTDSNRIRASESVVTELTIVLDGCGSVSRQLDGAPPQTIGAVPGAMWLTPACAREDFIDFESAIAQALHIYLAPDRFEFVCSDIEQRTRAISALRRSAPFRDPLLQEIARAVAAELQAPTVGSYALIAPLGLCLASRLLHAHTEPCRATTPQGQVSTWETRRFAKVREHVAAHLDQPLSVNELARVAFLSASRFAHAFKISTGESPQHYVSARRLDRAKFLLCESALTLAQVADRCGFSCQTSFTKAFVRATGQPPGRYRRHVLETEAGGRWQQEPAPQALVPGNRNAAR